MGGDTSLVYLAKFLINVLIHELIFLEVQGSAARFGYLCNNITFYQYLLSNQYIIFLLLHRKNYFYDDCIKRDYFNFDVRNPKATV